VEIDDHVISTGWPGCGQPRKLPDAELVCLAVAQVLLGARSEHHWLRICYGRLGRLFPCLPKQPDEVAAALLAHAARVGSLRPGLTFIGDKGFAGTEFEDLAATGFGLRLIRPDRRDEAPYAYTRIVQRLLAMAVRIWHNWSADAPATRSLITHDR
jgi:hypothetical protein